MYDTILRDKSGELWILEHKTAPRSFSWAERSTMAAIGEEIEELDVVPEPESAPVNIPQEPSPKQQPVEPQPEVVGV